MSDPIKIPQLAIQVSKPSRPEESRAPTETMPDPGPASGSFASVLKAKSQPASTDASKSEPIEPVFPDRIDPAAELVAAMLANSQGLTPASVAKSAVVADTPTRIPSGLDPSASAAALSVAETMGAETMGAENSPPLTNASDFAATTLAASASPGAADPASVPTAAPIATSVVLPVAGPIAVPPAPTPAASSVTARRDSSLPLSTVASSTASTATGSAPANPAVATANSADSGKSALPAELPDAQGEFRPVLERISPPADGIAMQSTAIPPNAPPAAEPGQVRIATPFNQPGWAQEVEQKLAWVITQTRQQADLVLNPPELGRIEVSLVVKGDEVSASFASPHQAVREAIEESLVRLRENLAEAGINLGQTHVGRDSSREAPFTRPEGMDGGGRKLRQDGEAVALPLNPGAWQPARGRGMVDVFA